MWLLCLFLGHLQFSAACPAAGYPSWVPHLAGSGWLAHSCSGRYCAVGPCCWVGGVLLHHLVFYLVPAQLPLPLLTLSGCCNPSGSSLLVYSCGGVLLLGWRCLCCVTWFSTMCRALPPGPAACAAYPAAGSLGEFPVTGCLSFCFPGDVGWASALPFFFCASPAPTSLQGLAGFCTLCQGASVGVVSALWSKVSSPCWLSLTLGWMSFWTTVSPVSAGCAVSVSTALRGSSTFSCLCLSFTFSGVGVAWSQVCDPSCGSWVLDSSGARLRRPDAVASGCALSFSRRGFLPWAFVRTWVSRQRSCLGSYLLLEVLSFPCPGFRWAVPAVWWSRRLLFSRNLTLGSSLSLPMFADGLRWLGFILGCPPSVS